MPDVNVIDGQATDTSISSVIALGTILVSVTFFLEIVVFWFLNGHEAMDIVDGMSKRALRLLVVDATARAALLLAGVGLLCRKPWAMPLYVWTVVVWTLAVAWLFYLIIAVVNLPIYGCVSALLYNEAVSNRRDVPGVKVSLTSRDTVSVICLSLSCAVHFWAVMISVPRDFFGEQLTPLGYQGYLFLLAPMFFIAGVGFSRKGNRLWSASKSLTVFSFSLSVALISNTVSNTSLHKYMPESIPRGEMPILAMSWYAVEISVIAIVLSGLLHFLRSRALRRSQAKPSPSL
ncbi:hypothetical protein PPN31114_02940 [Pandoraea pneumonica]|uniref:Uncharacterized protein n=1 Tax=Pandoraea pneumonica TaxID=2508299 RepID=A0A5E4VXW9_9BURK|nr:hypothetical protein [Pandoraea pneumonica]VVE16713.1 hypothetical protein PPN31114_02940 [Pandoraea pneumonica]